MNTQHPDRKPAPKRGPYSRETAEKQRIDEQERAARVLRDAGWSVRRVARLLGMSPANVARLTGPDSPLVRIGEVVIDTSGRAHAFDEDGRPLQPPEHPQNRYEEDEQS